MRIGVDIDGVLTNDDDYILDYATKYQVEKGLAAMTDPYQYEYRKFNWKEPLISDYRNHYFWNYVENEPARRFASEVLTKLKEEKNEIYIITSRYLSSENSERGDFMREKIKIWLEKNQIPYDELICTSKDKGIVCLEKQVDCMIEDSPITIPIITRSVFVFCYDTRYNRDLKNNHMMRIFSWYDFYQKFHQKYDKEG